LVEFAMQKIDSTDPKDINDWTLIMVLDSFKRLDFEIEAYQDEINKLYTSLTNRLETMDFNLIYIVSTKIFNIESLLTNEEKTEIDTESKENREDVGYLYSYSIL
jgi:hypothetical protein